MLANFTPDEKEKYTEGQKMIYDYQDCIDYAREKGEAKGRDEGLAEGLAKGEAKGLAEGEVKGLAKGEKIAKIETAKNLLNMGLSITRIDLATGLTEKDIENLLHR